jgi:hypothetical protein
MAYFAYDNFLRTATILSEDTTTNFEMVKGLDGRGYSRAGFESGADREVVFDFGTIKTFNLLLLANHNLGAVGATITILVSSDNVSYSSVGASTITTDYVTEWSQSNRTYRYVKIKISGHTGAAYIGDLYLGTKLDIPYGMPRGFISPDQYDTDTITTNITGNGALAGVDVIERPKRCKIPLKNFERSWFDDNWAAFVASTKLFPSYFVWGSGERPIYFTFYKKVGSPKFTTNNRQSVTLDVEGVV